MSANYRDLLKYAATGIASPSMTYYDKMRASTLMGGAVQTLTGIPPLSFKSNGKPLISWSMKGNEQQTGTPTPQNIIMPDFTGMRTSNLYPLDANKLQVGRIENDGTIGYKEGTVTISGDTVTYTGTNKWRGFYTDLIPVDDDEKLTISPVTSQLAWSCNCYDENGDFIGKASPVSVSNYHIFTLVQGTTAVRISATSESKTYTVTEPMLNIGSTALQYEPFGYKISLTCAGQTVPVYLGEVPTVRRVKKLVLTGESNINKKAPSNPNDYMYYLGGVQHKKTDCICSHLVSTDSFPLDAIGGVYSKYSSGLFYISLSIGVMNAQPSGNTVAGFKEYLAAQYAAGTPVTVWYVLATPETAIVNEPLCKIGDYADELSSTDAAVTIPTAKGDNTLTVDTPIQPSEMSITYKG